MRLVHAALVMILGVAASPHPPPKTVACTQVACSPNFAPNERRAERVRRLAKRDVRAGICFGVTDVSVVSLDGTMMLDERADDRVLAARVVHLQAHLDSATLFDANKRSTDCDAWVESVLALERRAFAMEWDVARDLGVTLPYGIGIEELRRGYAAQCAQSAVESPAR